MFIMARIMWRWPSRVITLTLNITTPAAISIRGITGITMAIAGIPAMRFHQVSPRVNAMQRIIAMMCMISMMSIVDAPVTVVLNLFEPPRPRGVGAGEGAAAKQIRMPHFLPQKNSSPMYFTDCHH